VSFTVASVIEEAREMLLDTGDITEVRYSDAFLARKVNQVLQRMIVKRPDIFSHVGPITTVAGTLQTCPDDAYRLVDVVASADGRIPKEINQEVQDIAFPAWPNDPAGSTINWARNDRDPVRFFVVPPAPAGTQLTVHYARCHPAVTATGIVDLPAAYFPTVIDGVCWLTEAIDAEHAENGRAAQFKTAFDEGLSTGLQARALTDVDDAQPRQQRAAQQR
jgi:hypothetical protein